VKDKKYLELDSVAAAAYQCAQRFEEDNGLSHMAYY